MLFALLLAACQPEAASVPHAAASTGAGAAQTALVQTVSWHPSAQITGSLDPVAAVQLGFDVPGRINTLYVHRGDTVREGQPVAKLDSAVAEAQLAQAQAALAGASAQATNGEANFGRAEKLKAAGALSEQQYADARAGVEAARAGVAQAKAATQLARTNLDLHTLRSPIAGVVSNGPDNAGTLVGAGTPTFLIEDISSLRIRSSAPEGSDWIHAGLAASVAAGPAGDKGTAQGVVARVLPALDPTTRRMPVEIRVEQPDSSLRAHAFARVTLTGDTDQAALLIPRAALIARPDFCVYLSTGPTATPVRVPVSVLEERGDDVVVSAALKAGDSVILNPSPSLSEQ